MVHATEIYLKQSLIELEDDTYGIFDDPKELVFLEWQKGIQVRKRSDSDPMNKDHMSMIRYWNMYLSKEQNEYYRVRYNLM